MRRLRVSQRVRVLGKRACTDESAKARINHGAERRTDVRIIETVPGPVDRSTVVATSSTATLVRPVTQAKSVHPSSCKALGDAVILRSFGAKGLPSEL